MKLGNKNKSISKNVGRPRFYALVKHKIYLFPSTVTSEESKIHCPICGYFNPTSTVRLHYGFLHAELMKWYDIDVRIKLSLVSVEANDVIDARIKLSHGTVKASDVVVGQDNYVINHDVVRRLCAKDGVGYGQNFMCQVSLIF